MQDVTQKKLKRQELKKWAVVVAVLVLALSFLLGAILISTNTVGKADAATGEDVCLIPLTYVPRGASAKIATYEGSYVLVKYISATGTTQTGVRADLTPIELGWSSQCPNATYTYKVNGEETSVFLIPEDDHYVVSAVTAKAGGWEIESLYAVPYNNSVALPAEPTAPEGQHFVGWYYDEALTNAYKDGDVITADTQLYAKFAANAYTVTYMVNGVQYSTSELEHGAAITNVVPTGVTTGKQFSGWFTDAACTQAYDFTTGNAITGDITLYGNIETVMLTVTFYVGTEVYTTLEVPYGSTLVKLAESNATAAAVLRVFNFAENSQIVAETEITDDVAATGTLDEKTVNWINTGAWFDANWPWLVACVGVVIIIIAGSVILAKKRR